MPRWIERAAGSILTAAILAGCSAGGPPKPGELKAFDAVCDKANNGKRLAGEGYLALPASRLILFRAEEGVK